MAEFPEDIMRAAREAFIVAAPQMDRASAERIRAGAMDDWHIFTVVATGILAERQRCVDKVRSLFVPDCNAPDDDPRSAAIVDAVEIILEPTA